MRMEWLAPAATLNTPGFSWNGPREAGGIGDALPRLDADQLGTGARPEPEIGRIGKLHFDLRSAARAVTHGTARHLVEDQHVVAEEVIRQRQLSPDDGSGMQLIRQQAVRR